MSFRALAILAATAFGLVGCAQQATSQTEGSSPADFGEVTLRAFERHPNLRNVPEGAVQDSMFSCALAWRSDHSTPEAEKLVNAAKAYDLMAAGDWDAIAPYCPLGTLKKYLP